ncbi:L-lactate transporter-like [Paramacrobiotus metropolitanus]|uniref:L-lactate transporter-like n=1 Tax=Paramacrobiotus metropolitanus TaxID=2943436 RepID=UPI002445C852|nr:L-lactate transporter-like [Paramacrobiotus metropolitanus]
MSAIWHKIKKAIAYHYSETKYVRTEDQLERERWLIPKLIPFSRYMLMPAAVLIQVCCGSLYAWSGFNLPIEAKLYGFNKGVDRAIAVNVFYVAVAIFALNAAFLGPWMERNGPLKGAMLGACLFYLGNLVTALGVYVNQMWLIFIGYGVIGGAGLGISYISPVSPLQKWFPEMRGIAAGLAVCGFGAGSIFSPYTQKALIGPDYAKTGQINLGIELTFVILGSCYFVIMALCAMVLRMPPPGYVVKGVTVHTVKGAENLFVAKKTVVDDPVPAAENGKVEADMEMDKMAARKSRSRSKGHSVVDVLPDYAKHFSMSLKQALTSPQYWMMYFMFLGSEITGLLIISKIQSIAQNQLKQSDSVSADINSGLGGVNLLGRLILPLVSDLIKSRKTLFIFSLICQAVCLGCLPSALDAQSLGGVLTCAFIIGFFYGGGFGMIPAYLADQFGAKNVGATHGVILTAWAIAGVCGGLIFTAVYNQQRLAYPDSKMMWYDVNFRWILAPVLFALILAILTPTNLRDQKLPRVEGERLRFRLPFGRMVRLINGRFRTVSVEEEEAEWQAYLSSLHVDAEKQDSRKGSTTPDRPAKMFISDSEATLPSFNEKNRERSIEPTGRQAHWPRFSS